MVLIYIFDWICDDIFLFGFRQIFNILLMTETDYICIKYDAYYYKGSNQIILTLINFILSYR